MPPADGGEPDAGFNLSADGLIQAGSIDPPAGPPDDAESPAAVAAEPAASDAAPSGAEPGRRPRRGIFELEGRAAPGLYALGWALCIAGLASLFIGIASSGGPGPGSTVFLVIGLAISGVALVAAAGAQGLQRAADGAAYAGPSPFIVFAASFFLTIVATFAIEFGLGAVGIRLSDQIDLLLSVLINAAVAVGLVRLLVVGPGALTWSQMGFRRPKPGEGSLTQDVGWGIALALPAFVMAYFLSVVLSLLLDVLPTSVITNTSEPFGILANLAAAAVIAPLWEETFYRGFVTTAWDRALGMRPAIIRGAIFFAVIHVLGVTGSSFDQAAKEALIAFAVRLPVAFFLGWALLRRRTLAAPIALHAAYNAVPLLLFLLIGFAAGS